MIITREWLKKEKACIEGPVARNWVFDTRDAIAKAEGK